LAIVTALGPRRNPVAGCGRRSTEVTLSNLVAPRDPPARIVFGDPMPEMMKLSPELAELVA
jgi:hypothetical protein